MGVADDTLAREESEEDRVVIVTIHASKGREYHSVVIPDYDCDVSRWGPAEVEEERRVVYVGVTRARDAVLFTVDTSTGFVHPFLRELVEEPEPGEHETLSAWLEEPAGDPDGTRLAGTPDDALRDLIADRLAEIGVLFPELVPETARRRRPATRGARGGAFRRRYRGHSRSDGSGGAMKCFAVGCVPGLRYWRRSSCSSKSVTVRRWCWRTCSSQLSSTKVSM